MAQPQILKRRMQQRRKAASDWTSDNDVLLQGEFGYEEGTGKVKIGDGITPWNGLDYLQGEGGGGLSAYEIAVQNGFVGTEDDWLDSLIGPQGPAGTSGSGALGYLHEQGVPSTTWIIDHNLPFQPAAISVVDSGGTEWEGDVSWPTPTRVVIQFKVAFGGTARLS